MGLLDGEASATSQPRVSIKRRTLISLVAFSLFTCLFLLRQSAFRTAPDPLVLKEHTEELSSEHSKKATWQPSEEWDPLDPIYDSFESSASRYASSIHNLTSQSSGSSRVKLTYHPYPDYDSLDYKSNFAGNYVPCRGPRGRRLNQSYNDAVTAFSGWPKGFPQASLGSATTVGIDQNSCFERHGRFDPYGLGADPSGTAAGQSPPPSVKWDDIDWGRLQRQCVDENRDRFDTRPRPRPGESSYNNITATTTVNQTRTKTKRSAILFRSYDGLKYNPDLFRTMRSVISELALASGGEYEAFLLVQIKDNSLPIFDNNEVYENVKQQRVPKEFWNITILWNEALWPKLYPLVPESSLNVHFSQWLPVQWFAQKYPHFDHYWNWEMDVRYTGHHYELLQALDTWSRKQPRKGLWERNLRFYIPSYYGDYENFTHAIQARYQSDRSWKKDDTTIWGPYPPSNQKPLPFDISPPAAANRPENDNFDWGVGEDADLITMLPMFNPDPTHYVWNNVHWNYPLFLSPAGPPRRTTIITFYRLSHRLLSMMHYENSRTPGHHMSSETWPQSIALHHGFKAVYAPQSVFMERDWPPDAVNFIFNNGDTERVINEFSGMDSRGEGSGGWESVFGLQREHNFDASTWYYRAQFATKLYRRYLGHEVDGIGGALWEKDHGTYCLPPMLLHPIKEIPDPEKVPTEEEQEVQEADDPRVEAVAESEKVEKEGQDAPGK
ncbi:MAG: hypothetical protein LQ340_000016 [Diploschistes diacapsis]|nr:MAG: hypothetical protein LQ340_000016 [Diploschistes diacapsis]